MLCTRGRDDRGVSVIELLVVASILGIVITLSYLVFNSATRISDTSQAKSLAREAGTRALNRMTRDVRQAKKPSTTLDAFERFEAGRCSFFIDVVHDPQSPRVTQRVTYEVSGTSLYRKVAPVTYVGSSPTIGQDGAPQLMLDGLNTSSGGVFSYYSQAYPALTATSTASISAVGLRIVNSMTVGRSAASSDLSTTVKVRSVHNELDQEK